MNCATTAGVLMAKKGRPPNPAGSGDAESRMVRLPNDLADKIGWIVRIKKRTDKSYTASMLLAPLIRTKVNAEYEQIKDEVERIMRGEERAAKRLRGAEEPAE